MQGLTALISVTNDLLGKYPILTKLAAAGAIALTGVGIAATTAALGIGLLSSQIGTLGTFALVSLVRANGLMGTYRLATTAAKSAASRLSVAVGGNAVAMKQAATSGLSLSGRLSLIGASAKNAGTKLAGIFKGGILRGGSTLLVSGFRSALGFVTTGVATIGKLFLGLGKMIGAALLSPFALVAAATVAVMKGIEYAYRRQEALEKKRGETLEQQRQAIVAQSFRDAGQPVPKDLGKTLDVSRAFVAGPDGKPIAELTDLQKELVTEIGAIQSAFESYRQRVEAAKRLVDIGKISKDQFNKFATQELEKFKANDKTTQNRESLRKELMTPIEIFRESIQQATKLFADEPLMFQRAREAAEAQFKANDKATQLANQLKTPLEQYKEATDQARKLFGDRDKRLSLALADAKNQFRQSTHAAKEKFAQDPKKTPEQNSENLSKLNQVMALAADQYKKSVADARKQFDEDPKNLKRALDSAAAQFRSIDPVAQFAQQLRTPTEVFNDRMVEISKTLAGVQDPAKRSELFDRAKKQALETLNQDDPDRVAAKSILESLKTGGETIAAKLTKAFALTEKGLLSKPDLQAFRNKLLERELGKRPDRQAFVESFQITSSSVASQIGNYAPVASNDAKMLEYQREQRDLIRETNRHLVKLGNKRGRAFKR